ncbi:hypothetical protein [Variovorax gossypii]|uniref:hypothetical protein n=1 Tax=uncultured Variovorax sp. TaxID=114708 RepID=UPI0026107886|nr:hypothetical protein [uncultured Variovorax sp.]
MKVAITYPADFPLTGWDKEVFHKRIQRLFDRSYFDTWTLGECRTKFPLPENDAYRALRSELDVWHCTEFRSMPDSVRTSLPGKVALLIGAGIAIRYETPDSWAHRLGRLYSPAMAVWLAVLCAILFSVCVGLIAVSGKLKARVATSSASIASEISPIAAIPPSDPLPLAAPSGTPTPLLEAQLNTDSPGPGLDRITEALKAYPGAYDVRIVLTPVAPGHLGP